jgi:pseudouridine kinase
VPVDVTGAGDALMAGTLAALLAGHDLVAAAGVGALLAARTIESTDTVLGLAPSPILERLAPDPGGPGTRHTDGWVTR